MTTTRFATAQQISNVRDEMWTVAKMGAAYYVEDFAGRIFDCFPEEGGARRCAESLNSGGNGYPSAE